MATETMGEMMEFKVRETIRAIRDVLRDEYLDSKHVARLSAELVDWNAILTQVYGLAAE